MYQVQTSASMATCSSSNSSSSKNKWRFMLSSLFIGVCLCIGCFVTITLPSFSFHFDHGMERVLLSIQQAPGIKLTFQAREGSVNHPHQMIVHGFVFPHRHHKTKMNQVEKEEEDAFFFDGRLSYIYDGHLFNYTLLEGRGYMTIQNVDTRQVITSKCLEASSSLPPIHDIAMAMKTARVIEKVPNRSNISCEGPDAKLVEFFFANEPYVVCTRGHHQIELTSMPWIDTIHGEDFLGSMEFLSVSSEEMLLQQLLSPSSNLNFSLTKCPPLLLKTPLTPPPSTTKTSLTRRALLSGMALEFQRKMVDTYHFLQGQPRPSVLGSEEENQNCNQCQNGLKACLFVHGLHGLGKVGNLGLQDEYRDYFGEIQNHLPCCHTIKFLVQDTDHHAWYEDFLPHQVCDAALQLSSNDFSTEIQDVVLIAHSMGNLVISSALMKNLCSIGKNSKWIALQGPIEGSMSSTRATEICIDNVNTKWDDPWVSLFHAAKLCPAKQGVLSLTYNLHPKTSQELKDLYSRAMLIYYQNVDANLCGIIPQGLASIESAKYLALSILSQHPIPQNDGAVDFNSCRGPFDASLYSNSWKKTNFYRANINHGDGALRHGDGWWGESRRPIKWLQCQF
jgi:hypothetical protein